ncbi:M48 family metallopeptidase [Niveibacterium sp. 24ML]|uniref:M48 family metallopeptidase n=1 Tax=Niveibacterium sp. 24ML TaxID=2985512 RepID=UPI00227086AD|nr:M48 family metallopeptidase [Niveibacterium sp. 24ML]MCX9155971.1 M48 family metallopeptidase [Niveibacterium sp. 24ML]
MPQAETFAAHAFHESLPGGRCSGAMVLDGGHLHFTRGEQVLALPIDGLLRLTLGGANNRLIFIEHAALPGWQFYTADHALIAHARLAAHPAAQALVKARRRHRWLGWGSLFAGLALIVALPVILFFSLDGLSDALARRLPVAWEASLGETALKQFRVQQDFMSEAHAAPLLKPLVDPLVAHAGKRYRYRFHVVNDPSLNAFALPGGEVVIHSGLILKAGTPAQLQGVLAHEIAHVTEQHGVRSVIKSVGLYAIAQALLGDASGLLAAVAGAAPMLINQKYSRDFEREADRAGIDLLLAARIDPRGLVAFFHAIRDEEHRQLKQLGDDEVQDAARSALAYLGTHPETDERIANLDQRIQTLPAFTWRDDRAAFAVLQEAVKAFVSKPTTKDTNASADPGQ